MNPRQRVLDPPPPERCLGSDLDAALCMRLAGRYGTDAPALITAARAGELLPIDSCMALWAARAEGIIHLDDLLLRRVRLGLIAPQGGVQWLDRIRSIVQPELGWDDPRWDQEASEYTSLWKRCYSLAG